MDWQVTLTVQLDQAPTVELHSHLADILTSRAAALAGPTPDNPNDLGVVLTVENIANALLAAREGFDELATALATIPDAPRIVAVTEADAITVDEADRREDEPDIPELVSGVEAAAILGVSRQRVHQLSAEHPRFPRPVARLASGSVWLRSNVEGFATQWPRRTGRPRRTVQQP